MDAIERVRRSIMNRIKWTEKYRAVFDSNPVGREVLEHILKTGFVTKTTFVANDPHQTILNEGSRRLALSILRAVAVDADKMIKQAEQQLENSENEI